MSNGTTIVLCGGPINYSSMPIGTTESNAMIPVNGKPVIGWILDDLLAKGIRRVTVVLQRQDKRLRDFLGWAYASRLDLDLALVDGPGTIIGSLKAGLKATTEDSVVRVVLGDTLIRDTYDGDEDFVYVGDVEDSRRWCLAVLDDHDSVVDYIDKKEGVPSPRQALAGYYHLLHGWYLRSCVADSIAQGESELSSVLRRYGALHAIHARTADSWCDFGHIDNLVRARRTLLKPRYFNSLSVNPILNTITKTSKHDQKLRDELDWYLQLPERLKVLTPRIVDWQQTDGHLEVVQEYYGYPTLSELYVYGDLHPDTWSSILRRMMLTHEEFRLHKGSIPPGSILEVYVNKTWERLETLCNEDGPWAELLEHESISFNGEHLINVGLLAEAIEHRGKQLADSADVCIIHGDLCFSNILFDVNYQIIRLIDPRGSFGVKGIYGDPRYDIAKLRHSIAGLYDFIIADLFHLAQEGTDFTCQIYANGVPRQVAAMFDHMVEDAGYDLDEIKLIEGLLFLSMLPLHRDHPERQKMMYLTGLSRLNEVLLPGSGGRLR